MDFLVLYSAFLGTFLSVTLLSYLAWKEHNPQLPRTLSKLAAQNRELINWFRAVLWTCGTLFAVTMFFHVIPAVQHQNTLLITWTVYYVCELLLALFPARGTIENLLHTIFSYAMSAAMFITAVLFSISLSGIYKDIEIGITIAMLMFAMLTYLDKKRFIFYELLFIYSSHISILVAAIAIG